jgi:hypothetical protein
LFEHNMAQAVMLIMEDKIEDGKRIAEKALAMAVRRTVIKTLADLDIVSAIWILSCNDENPIITYRGLYHRLGLSPEFDVRAAVLGRRELFRPGILQSRLKDWKAKLREGKQLPGWISEIADKTRRLEAIDSLTPDDVFRNQFRVEPNAPKCPLDIMNWGLEHIFSIQRQRVTCFRH